MLKNQFCSLQLLSRTETLRGKRARKNAQDSFSKSDQIFFVLLFCAIYENSKVEMFFVYLDFLSSFFFAFVFVIVVFVLQEDEVRPLGFTDPPKLPLIGLHWYSPPHHFHATAKATNQRQSRAGLIGENIGIYNYCVCASVSFGPNDTDNCFSSSRSEQKEAQI